MDTVTHGLTGLLISRALPGEIRSREAAVASVAGAILPDADQVATLLGGEMYVRMHRGFSHSFLCVTLTSLAVALLIHRFGKWKDLRKIYLLVLAGQFSHILLDLLNSYGTQIFQPFSDARVSFDILFVVDLLFTGIVAAGILLARGRPAPARMAMGALALYVAAATGLHLRAESAVRQAAQSHGVPVVSVAAIPRLPEVDVDRGLSALKGIREAWAEQEGNGMPVIPFSDRPDRYPFPAGPLAWSGFVDDGATYLRAEVDPLSGAVTWKERVRRGMDLPEVRAVGTLSDVRTYLWFARFPVVQTAVEGNRMVLTFSDMRFGEVPGRRRPFVLKVIDAPGEPPKARWG